MILFHHELIHLLLTTLVAVFIWLRYGKGKPSKLNTNKTITNYTASRAGRKLLIIGIFTIGIFLDVDHLFDYFMWSKGSFILSDFLNPSLYVHASGKVYVPFHGFEFIPLIWLLGKSAEKRLKSQNFPLALAITLSYTVHLFWDNLSFYHHPLAYSLIYRIINQFSVQCFNGL